MEMTSIDEQEERWVEIELRRRGGPGRDLRRVVEDSERVRVRDSDRSCSSGSLVMSRTSTGSTTSGVVPRTAPSLRVERIRRSRLSRVSALPVGGRVVSVMDCIVAKGREASEWVLIWLVAAECRLHGYITDDRDFLFCFCPGHIITTGLTGTRLLRSC